MNEDKDKIEKCLEICGEIHSECILTNTVNINEIIFLVGKIYGILSK